MERFWALGHFNLAKCTALTAFDCSRIFLKLPDAPAGPNPVGGWVGGDTRGGRSKGKVELIVGAMLVIDRPLDMCRTVVNVVSDS